MSGSVKVLSEPEARVVTQDPFGSHLIKTRSFSFILFLLSWLHYWLVLSEEKIVNWFI